MGANGPHLASYPLPFGFGFGELFAPLSLTKEHYGRKELPGQTQRCKEEHQIYNSEQAVEEAIAVYEPTRLSDCSAFKIEQSIILHV